tara:strand:+ start:1402 stop:2346 length:945 start_codon:yes stop_codon:yes gene_type:complete
MPKISVIGCGYWGKNHIRNFFNLDSLYSVSDLDEKLSSKFSQQFEVKNQTFEEILDDPKIDGVSICSPAFKHKEMAIRSLKSGKNVLVEKPLAMSAKEAREIKRAQLESGKIVMVGHLMHYHSAFTKLKDIVSKDEFGNIRCIESSRKSYGKIRTEEDVVWSFAPHDISMIMSLINSSPNKISSKKSYVLGNNLCDTASIFLEFEHGITANISLSWVSPVKEQRIIVVGEKQSIIFDDTKDWEDKLTVFHNQLKAPYDKVNMLKEDGIKISLKQNEPLESECKYFLDLIQNKVQINLTDIEEGIRVLEVLESCS